MPCFVYIVDFSGENEPQKEYFCHIDKSRIGATLQRLRELSVKEVSDFHKRTMQLVAREDESCSFGRSEDLIGKINKYIDGTVDNYVKDKSDFVRTVGFEKGSHILSMTSVASITDFTNAMLGVGKIKMLSGKIYDSRFGVKSGERVLEAGELSVTPVSSGECTIQVTLPNALRRVRGVGTVYVTPPVLPEEMQKLRVARKSFSLLISKHEFTMNFDLSLDERYTPKVLKEDLSLLMALSTKDAQVELIKDGQIICKGRCPTTVAVDPGIIKLKEAVDAVHSLMNDFGINDNIEFTLPLLNEQSDDISWFLHAKKRDKFGINFDLEVPSRRNVSRKKGIFANPVVIRGVDKSLILLSYWQAKMSVNGNRVTCEINNPTVDDVIETVHKDDDHDILNGLLDEFERKCRALSKGNLINKTLKFREAADDQQIRVEQG